jgi:signal transduction histidine kinase
MTNDSRDRRSGAGIVAVSVAQFALIGLIALLIVAISIWIASRRVGEREAIANARRVTELTAKNVVEPAVPEALRHDDPVALARLDSIVRNDVLDDSLVRVKIWTPDGRIIYSDATELIGATYELGDDEQNALRTGVIEAEVSDLDATENRFEREYDKLLEVYLPIGATGSGPLLFEAYYRYDDVAAAGSQLWRSFAPISVGGLVVLELVQIPLAWSLARRLRDRLREREALTWRALEASEAERRQIAGDLHDGVVQQLTGVAYALSAMARQPSAASSAELESAAEDIRNSVRDLRSLVVDLTPATVQEQGLAAALDDLARRMANGQMTIDVVTDGSVDRVDPVAARLLYRVALEGLRNVVQHAGASTARLNVSAAGTRTRLEVIDDGSGFEPAILASRAAEGHVGLRALHGIVVDAGGTFEVVSAPGAGTTLRVEVPTR